MGLIATALVTIYLAIGAVFAVWIKFYKATGSQTVIVRALAMLIWPAILALMVWSAKTGKSIVIDFGKKKGDE